MNHEAQKNLVTSVSAPKLLRRGLQVGQVGLHESRRYIIRDTQTGRKSILKRPQFFILDQLSSCDTFDELKLRYQAKFSKPLSRQTFDETVEIIARGKLWGRQAQSHPLLAPLLPAPTVTGGKRLRGPDAQRRFHRSKKAVAANSKPGVLRKKSGDTGDPGRARNERVNEGAEPAATATEYESDAALETEEVSRDHGSEQHYSDDIFSDEDSAPNSTERPARRRAWHKAGPQTNGSKGRQLEPGKSSIFPQWVLFDARPMLNVLLPVVAPSRKVLLWALPILLVTAWFIVIKHTENFLSESDRLLESLSFLVRLVVSLLTVNLLSIITKALAARHFSMRVQGFGIRLVFWLLPRFMIATKVNPRAPRAEQAWVHAMPLLTKLYITGGGVLLWFLTRTDDSGLSHFGFWLAVIGFVTFILTAVPLFPASGYQLLAIATGEPNLRQKALGSLKAVLTFKRLPEGGGFILAIYGLSFILFMGLLLGFIFFMVGIASQRYFSTTGITVFASFLAFIAYRIYQRVKQKGKKQRAGRGQGQGMVRRSAGPGQALAPMPGRPGQGMVQRRPTQLQTGRAGAGVRRGLKPKSRTKSLVKLVLAGALLVVMFLPYPYESGGQLLIRPVDSQEISTEFDGIIEEVFFEGGETVEPGVLLAKLSSNDAARQVTIHNARIAEQQAEIDRLLAKPTQEEIDLAEEALRVEQTKAEYSRLNLVRKEKVFEQNVISQEEIETARREHEVDLGNVREAEANLALVKAGATPEELQAAEAELLRWEEERNLYQDQYDESFLYMPIHGKLITQHLKQKIGQFLNRGETFAVVENTAQVLGEIEVPEFDVGVIKLDAEVRARVWAYHDEIFLGKITSIDTNVEERSFGNIVKVITLLDNADQRLKTGMTGYAKVSGDTRPVWEVLFLTIVRFVQVEMWSWIP